MRKQLIAQLATCALLLLAATASGQAQQDESLTAQTPLGQSLKDIEVASHWIYDDLPKAMAEAKATGKPLLVVLRCVPCPPGRRLDTKVMRPDSELEQLEKQFVCLRIIQANDLDMSLFQYDYDMSWSSMFLNADGTVYGRYGTRDAHGPESDAHLSPEGFAAAAKRALELHKQYPANKSQLAAKRGKSGKYDHPREIPSLADRPARATEKRNCIHCHMVREHALRAQWLDGKLTKEDLWAYPMPERIGLSMEVDDGLIVEKVADDSAAAKAGIVAGDKLVALAAQPLVSTADIQWVLHHSPKKVVLPVKLARNGQTLEKTVSLSGDWKKADIAWRASSWYGLRQGVKTEPLPEADKASRGIDSDGLALVIKGLYGRGGPHLKEAGIQQGDVIVAVDDRTNAMDESEFLTILRTEYGPDDSVKLTVLRGKQRREFTVSVW